MEWLSQKVHVVMILFDIQTYISPKLPSSFSIKVSIAFSTCKTLIDSSILHWVPGNANLILGKYQFLHMLKNCLVKQIRFLSKPTSQFLLSAFQSTFFYLLNISTQFFLENVHALQTLLTDIAKMSKLSVFPENNHAFFFKNFNHQGISRLL